MRRVLLVAAAVTALSCTPKTPASAPTPANPPGAPPPPPAPAPPPAAPQGLRLGPSAQRYVMHTVIHIDQEFQGMHQPLDFGLRAFFGVTITGPADSVTVTSINRVRAAAGEDHNGTRVMRLEVTSNFTIKGSGQQAGQPFEVAGSGVRNGVDFVAVDGRYVGGESRDSTAMTITLPIQAMTIPRTQVSKTTVTVLP